MKTVTVNNMKRIYLLIGFLFCTIYCFAQPSAYPRGPIPIIQGQASATTLLKNNGIGKDSFATIIPTWPDTATANANLYIKYYPGAMIRTLSPSNTIWARNDDGTAWIQVGSGSGVNIYNSDGILTQHRVLTGNNNTYSLTLDSLSGFTVKANVGAQYSRLDLSTFVTGISYIGNPNTSSVSVANGNVSMGIVSGNGVYISSDSIRKSGPGIGLSNDTTNRKIQTINPITGAESYSNWIGSGGAASAAGNSHDVQLNRNGSFYGSDSLLFNGNGLTILNAIRLPNSTVSVPAIYLGGVSYLHNYGPSNDNIALGRNAGSLSSTSTNRFNVAIGYGAGPVVQSLGNIFIGNLAGSTFTAAADPANDGDNVFIGQRAGGTDATGTRNSVFIGPRAGESVTTGSFSNTGIGKYNLEGCTTCSANSMYGASINLTTGIDNSAIGADILVAGTSASYNSLSGMYSYSNTTSGSYNISSGYHSGYNNTIGSNNVALGDHAVYTNVTGNNNIGLGAYALAFNASDDYMFSVHSGNGGTYGKAVIGGNLQTGDACVGCREDSVKLWGAKLAVIGNLRVTHTDSTSSPQNMLYRDQQGYFKIAAVPSVSSSLTVGTTVVNSGTDGRLFYQASGVLSQSANLTLASNILSINGVNIGRGTGGTSSNTAVGNTAGNAWTSATLSTAIGDHALAVATSGDRNTAVGYNSLTALTTGNYNTALGAQTLSTVTSGSNNTAVGIQALFANTGSSNTSIGFQSMLASGSGGQNTAIGYSALVANTSGATNTAIGYNAGSANTTGGNNTYIGFGAGGPTTTSGNTVIGAQVNIGTGLTNNIAIGNGTGAIKAQHDGTNWTFTGSATLTNGSLTLGTAGNKLNITTGSNASAGVSGAMTAGTITISTTAVTANSIVILTPVGAGSGSISRGTVTAGTSFVINSSDGADVRAVQWLIIN
jgi:hypothetical protein